jgi:hypothetical protein
MRDYWDERAREDAYFFVDNRTADRSELVGTPSAADPDP